MNKAAIWWGSEVESPYQLVYPPGVGGTGSGHSLPLSDKELAALAKREKTREPIGFVAPLVKQRRRK